MSNLWPTTTVGELFDIGAGKSVTPASRLGERRYPFLRTANVFWGRIDLTAVDSMNYSDAEIAVKSLRKGDLLVCEGGDIGRAAVWNGEIKNCSFQNHLHRLRPKIDDTIPLYFMYYLQAGFTLLGIYEGAGNKTTIPNLSRSRLEALKVPKPPKQEQEKIAAVLWKVQRAIEFEEKVLVTTRELKQSAMQHFFTEGLFSESRKETEIGSIPESWQVTTLSELFGIRHGFACLGEFFAPTGKFVVLTPGHFDEKGGFKDQRGKTKFYLGEVPTGYILYKNDLLVAMTEQTPGLLGSSILIPESEKFIHNQRLGLIVDLNEARLEKHFLYQRFNAPDIRQRIAQTATGSKVKHTSPGRILELKIGLPSLKEQREIATVLQVIDRKISIHEQKYATLKELFKALLHQIMTGKIRVTNLKIDLTDIQP